MEMPLGQRLRNLPGPLLLTGHTGFKGTWMTYVLEHLQIPVVGYALPAERDSLFNRAQRTGTIPEEFSDIRDYEALERFIDLHKPSTIIHMAAQPLVLTSYENPFCTFEVNVSGTLNVLDIAFKKDYVKGIVVVTTDKVYKNENSGRAYIESDALFGEDPYSASKVATEAVVAAWQHLSTFSDKPRIVSVRAGNVIGGGDFAENRIIPDLIRGVINKQPVEIRNPESVRPWQHVLDPIVGYLMALEHSLLEKSVKALNFGPKLGGVKVIEVVEACKRFFPELITFSNSENQNSKLESRILEIDSSYSQALLGWKPVWGQEKSLERTFDWWEGLLTDNRSPDELCSSEIQLYFGEM
jgi:CDP-glucose 4,6-dehydratase